MNIVENIKMALDSIRGNKLRSFLTMLGIIIGISSVIAIISLGEGGRNTLMGDFEKIGASTVIIKSNTLVEKPNDKITLKDVDAIKNNSSYIKYISPIASEGTIIKVMDETIRGVLLGGNNDLYYIRNSDILYGRYFTEKDVSECRDVVVVDNNFAEKYFGYEDVVGEYLIIGNTITSKKVTIIGVVKLEDYLKEFANGYMPIIIYTPITTLNNIFDNKNYINEMYIMANSKQDVENATYEALNILKSRHNNREENPYMAEGLMKQVSQINNMINLFTSFVISVAAISLFVGGIGVMNIMLVSVTERTREIGIRKALGATTKEILIQFILESVTISLIGGFIGLILGLFIAIIIGSYVGVTPNISVKAIIIVMLFSSAVGIFFGIYPAKKAANLNPIDALRFE